MSPITRRAESSGSGLLIEVLAARAWFCLSVFNHVVVAESLHRRFSIKCRGVVVGKVEVSNTAVNMVASLYPGNRSAFEQTLERIKHDVNDWAQAKRIVGLRDTFVVRSGPLRVIYTKRGDEAIVTSIETHA